MNVDVSKSEEPAVSIVMAAYNEADHIRAAIDSIINQTFTDWELIIVEDGSTDQTKEICEEFEKRDPRVRVFVNEQNLGLPRSLNLGIEQARGNLIARADADDINLPSRLAVQFAFMQEHLDIDVLGTGAYVIDERGRRVTTIALPAKHEQIKKLPFLKTMFFHPTVMIRRVFFDQVGLYDPVYRRAQDKELWFRGLCMDKKYHNLQEPLIHYRDKQNRFSLISIFSRAKSNYCIAKTYRVSHPLIRAIYYFLFSYMMAVREKLRAQDIKLAL